MNETTQKRQGNFLTRLVRKQIFIPLAALLLLIVFNLISDPSFFAITLKENSLGDLVLTGNLITILDNASELVILAIGMTLVTAASGGQDISVGSAIAIAGVVRRTNAHQEHHQMLTLLEKRDLDGLMKLMNHHLEESKTACLHAVKGKVL